MPKYTPVPAAVKYAEVGEDRPKCKCHGELMAWHVNHRCRLGGGWGCRVNAIKLKREKYKENQDKMVERSRNYRQANKEKVAEKRRDKYYRMKYNGWCTKCAEGKIAISEALCWDCLDKQTERDMMKVY